MKRASNPVVGTSEAIRNSSQYQPNQMHSPNIEIKTLSDKVVSNTRTRSPGGTFTFLRKNSRKEPSALNRMSNTPSPNSKETSKYTPLSSNKIHNSNTSKTSINDISNDNNVTDNNEEIILSGSSYWGIEETESYIKGYLSKQQSPDRIKEDILENSTMSIVAKQWALQKSDFQQELKEFELIEKQLEINTSNTDILTKPSVLDSTDILSKSKDVHYKNDYSQQNVIDDSFISLTSQMNNNSTQKSYTFDDINSLKLNQSESTYNFDSSYPFKTAENTTGIGNSIINDFDEIENTNQYNTDFSTILKGSSILSSHSNLLDSQSWGRPTQPNIIVDSDNYHDRNYQPEEKKNDKEQSATMKVRLSNNTLKKANALQQQQQYHQQYQQQQLPENEINTEERVNQNIRSFHPNYHIEGDYSYNDSIDEDCTAWEESYADDCNNNDDSSQLNNHIQDNRNNYSRSNESLSTSPMVITRPVSSQSRSLSASSDHNHKRINNNSARKMTDKSPLKSYTTELNKNGNDNEELQRSLIEKAHALESELETYKNENANLKKLRKQQENTLSEIMSQKEDLFNWIETEKQKTMSWCNEQKQLAMKERNHVAKIIRDNKQKALNTSQPIRKEKAEIEGLQATIEKLKLDYDNAIKKYKTNENRLYSLIKDHTMHIETNEKQLLCLEQEKLLLLEFISEQGLRLPKQLRSLLQKTPTSARNSNNIIDINSKGMILSGSNNNYNRNSKGGSMTSNHRDHRVNSNTTNSIYEMETNGYAEEIDVDDLDLITSTVKIDETTATTANNKQSTEYDFYDNYNTIYNNMKENNSSQISHQTKDQSYTNTINNNNNNNNHLRNSRDRYSTINMNEEELLVNTATTTNSSNINNHYLNDSMNKSRNSYSNSIKNLSQSILPPTPLKYQSSTTTPTNNSNKEFNNNIITNKDSIANNMNANTTAIFNNNPSDHSNNNNNNNNNNNRIEEILPNGKRIIKYKNGTQKEIDINGNTIVRFLNGDTKRTDSNTGIIIYYYALADTRHTTYPDGLEVYEFPNKQLEKHHPNGMKEIIFPDSTRKVITPDGVQECYFPDGVILREYTDGRKAIISNSIDEKN